MKIVIETIPHETHRYPTCGDWFYDSEGTLQIKVSILSSWKREMLIAVHELVEVLLCKSDGVSQQAVDKFDMTYELQRRDGNSDEPGDDPLAPYAKQHCIATGIERVLCAHFGENWKEYEEELDHMPEEIVKQR